MEYYKSSPGIILDIGNVLVSVDMENIHSAVYLACFTNSAEEGAGFMKGIENLCNTGMADMDSAIDMYFGHMKRGAEEWYFKMKKKLIDYWCSGACIRLNKAETEYIYKILDDKGISFFFASNLGRDHYRHIMGMHPLFSDKRIKHVCSFQVGAVKPQHLFFRTLSEMGRFSSNGCSRELYIDDRQENLDGGSAFGFEVFQYNSLLDAPAKFTSRIEAFLDECR